MPEQTDAAFLRDLILFYDMFDGHSNRLGAIADRLEANVRIVAAAKAWHSRIVPNPNWPAHPCAAWGDAEDFTLYDAVQETLGGR